MQSANDFTISSGRASILFRHLSAICGVMWTVIFTSSPVFAQDGPTQPTATSFTVAQPSLEEAAGRFEYIKGLTAFEFEDYETALELLSSAYVKLPNHGGVNLALADTYLRLRDLTNAEYYARQAVTLEPANKWYHIKLAEIYLESGDVDSAIDEYGKAADTNSDDINLLMQLANAQAMSGRFQDSNETLNRVLRRSGQDVAVRYMKVKNFQALNQPDSVVAELQIIQREEPDNLSTAYTLSQFYMERGALKEAKAVLEQALGRNSRDPQATLLLADIYMSEKEWGKVDEMLTRLIADPVIEPQQKKNYVEYIVERQATDPENRELTRVAGSAVHGFVDAHGDFGPAYGIAADYFQGTGETNQALIVLKSANELMPENAKSWQERVQILYNLGRYDEAITVSLASDEHVPENTVITYILGTSYMATGDYPNAIKTLKRASRYPARKAFKAVLFGGLGDAYAAVDAWEDAFKNYTTALRLDKNNHRILNNYAHYLVEAHGDLQLAKTHSSRAVDLQPGNPSYLGTSGWIQFKLGDTKTARESLEKAVRMNGVGATTMEHLGDVYEQLGKKSQAREWWQKALDADRTKLHLRDKIADSL